MGIRVPAVKVNLEPLVAFWYVTNTTSLFNWFVDCSEAVLSKSTLEVQPLEIKQTVPI